MRVEPLAWLRRHSVKSRVAFSATLLLGLTLVVAALAISGLEERSLILETDAALDDRIATVIEKLAVGPLSVDVPTNGRVAGVIQVIDVNDTVLAATPGLHRSGVLDVFTPPVGQPRHVTMRRAVGTEEVEAWRIAGQRVDTPTGAVDIFAASPLDNVDHVSARRRATLLAGVPLLVAFFAIISWLTTKWSLAPVEELTRAVDVMSAADVESGLPEPETHDEIAHLVRTMNSLLGRVADARRRERRFAADASHELRTPIATARLNLEIAQANPTPEHLARAIDETLIEVERLETLARDLLELTRLDGAHVRAQATEVDLAALVRAEVAKRDQREAHGLHLKLDANGTAPVLGVSSLLTRVVRNLLENAERHAASRIDVAVRCDPVGRLVLVTVHNDGRPIAAEDRRRIFDPFTRLDDARTRDDGGSGLGLAIAADIVEAHGGTIGVIDDVRPGATFRIAVPGMGGAPGAV